MRLILILVLEDQTLDVIKKFLKQKLRALQMHVKKLKRKLALILNKRRTQQMSSKQGSSIQINLPDYQTSSLTKATYPSKTKLSVPIQTRAAEQARTVLVPEEYQKPPLSKDWSQRTTTASSQKTKATTPRPSPGKARIQPPTLPTGKPVSCQKISLAFFLIPWLFFSRLSTDDLKPGAFLAHDKTHNYAKRSTVFWLSNKNCVRHLFVWLATWKYFEWFMILCIFINIICMTMFDYKDRDNRTAWNYRIDLINKVLTYIYLFEAVTKIVAMGFIWGEGTYLRSVWNMLDFAIVFSGILEILKVPFISIKSLKLLRAFRPLKSINSVKSMRRLVTTLIHSLPALLNVAFFMLFIVVIFAIWGLQTFSGDYYSRCRFTLTPKNATYWATDSLQIRPCNVNFGDNYCTKGTYCGHFRDYDMDLIYDGVEINAQIQYGISNFDNFLQSCLAVSQIITFDSWTTVMYNLMDSSNYWLGGFYCCSIVLLCSFFLLNLILAVIMQSFSTLHQIEQIQNIEKERKQQEEAQKIKFKRQRTNYLKRGTTLKPAGRGSFAGGDALRRLVSPNIQAIKLESIMEEKEKTKEVTQQDLNIHQNKTVQHKTLLRVQQLDEESGIGAASKIGSGSQVQRQASSNDQSIVNFAAQHVGMINQGQNDSAAMIVEKKIIEGRLSELKKSQKNERQIELLIDERKEKGRIYKVFATLSRHTAFAIFINLMIIANAITMAADRYPIPQSQEKQLEQYNFFFLTIFLAEMIIKLIGLGPKIYVSDRFNLFDAFIVIVSLIEVGFASNNASLSVMRVFRLLRVFKLAKSWYRLQNLLLTIYKTLKDVSSFSFLLLLVMLTYTLIGMELFAYKVKFNDRDEIDLENGEYPESTFNTFHEAMYSVFIVLANDGWTTIFFNHYRVTIGFTSTPFFISLLIIGQYILLNLFLAILLGNFNEEYLNEQAIENYNQKNNKKRISFKEEVTRGLKSAWKNFKQSCNRKVQNTRSFNFKRGATIDTNGFRRISTLKTKVVVFSPEKPLYLVPLNAASFLRKVCDSKQFVGFILICIVLQILKLWLDNPLSDPSSKFVKILYIFDIILSVIFILECGFKILAYGLIFNGGESYLRNWWNVIDFAIVGFSILSLLSQDVDTGIFKLFRILKVLRPLRVVSRNEGLKLSIQSLLMSIPALFQIILISVLFFMILGIIGVNNFKGAFFECEDLNFTKKVPHKWACINAGGNWENKVSNFDDVFSAMVSVFHMATTAGWAEVMYQGLASRGIDLSPERLARPYFGLFFMLLMIIGSFFAANLFIGVVIAMYNCQKEIMGNDHMITPKQKTWLKTKLLILKSQPKLLLKAPRNKIRLFFFNIANSFQYEITITICISLNTLLMTLHWYGISATVVFWVEFGNYTFTVIFLVEAICKIIGLGKRYFRDRWNIFDFSIVIISICSIILQQLRIFNFARLSTLLRAFRLGRIFKILRKNKSMRVIFQTFLMTLPALANVGSLLMLFLFMYAVLGVYLFAHVKINPPLNDHINFQDVNSALLTLLRVTTGENWQKVLFAVTMQHSLKNQCIQNPSYEDYKNNDFETLGCGSRYPGVAYFVSFIIVIFLTFLNLFIAIILQGFEHTNQILSSDYSQDTQDRFRDVWANFDPHASGFIKIKNFEEFMFQLGPPCGWPESYMNNKRAQHLQKKLLNLTPWHNDAHYEYYDVLEHVALNLLCKTEIRKESAGLSSRAGKDDKHGPEQSEINLNTQFEDEGILQSQLQANMDAFISAENHKESMTAKQIREMGAQKKNKLAQVMQLAILQKIRRSTIDRTIVDTNNIASLVETLNKKKAAKTPFPTQNPTLKRSGTLESPSRKSIKHDQVMTFQQNSKEPAETLRKRSTIKEQDEWNIPSVLMHPFKKDKSRNDSLKSKSQFSKKQKPEDQLQPKSNSSKQNSSNSVSFPFSSNSSKSSKSKPQEEEDNSSRNDNSFRPLLSNQGSSFSASREHLEQALAQELQNVQKAIKQRSTSTVKSNQQQMMIVVHQTQNLDEEEETKRLNSNIKKIANEPEDEDKLGYTNQDRLLAQQQSMAHGNRISQQAIADGNPSDAELARQNSEALITSISQLENQINYI